MMVLSGVVVTATIFWFWLGNKIESDMTRELNERKQERKLVLEHARLKPEQVTLICSFPQLDELHLRDCDLNDETFATICDGTHVSVLEVPDNKSISGAGLKHLGSLKDGLRELDLSGLNIDEKDLEGFGVSGFSNLKRLVLNNCNRVPFAYLNNELRPKMPRCEFLSNRTIPEQ